MVISVFDISLVMIFMILPELLFQYIYVQNNELKIRLTMVANDRKTGLGHLIVIICMLIYYYALHVFIIVDVFKNVIFLAFSFIENATGMYKIYKIVKGSKGAKIRNS